MQNFSAGAVDNVFVCLCPLAKHLKGLDSLEITFAESFCFMFIALRFTNM